MLIFLLIGLILLEEFIEFLYKKTDSYKNTLGGADRFKKVPNGIEICNIGSGPGLYAISYEDCNLKGFNFSTAPQNYKYGFKLLKRFQDKIKEHAIIIIIIMCPLSFGANKDYDRKDYSDKFYGILEPKDIDNYSIKRAWITSHPLIVKVLKKVKCLFLRKKIRAKETVVKSTVPPVLGTWKREFDLVDLIDPSQVYNHQAAFIEKINTLQDGLDFCYEKKWRPIFVTPPIPEETRNYIGDEFINEFVYRNVEVLLKNNSSLKYLNYFDDKLPDEYFANDVFMSKDGQKYFSKMLFDRIKDEMEN